MEELQTEDLLTFEGVHIYDKDLKLKCLIAISTQAKKFYLIHLGLRNKETAANMNSASKNDTIKIGRIFDIRELGTLMKITSRKNLPELLTFKFGSHESLKPEMLKVQKSLDDQEKLKNGEKEEKEEKNNEDNQVPESSEPAAAADEKKYEFDCVLKIFMKSDAGDAARKIKRCLQEVYSQEPVKQEETKDNE